MNNNNEKFEVESESENYIYIRGKRINLDDLVNCRLLSDNNFIQELREKMHSAEPYQHIVTQEWFNPTLLELIHDEFDLIDQHSWKKIHTDYEMTYRSQLNTVFGPATKLYFGLVNSGWFLNLLSRISNINDLIPDPMLQGGGLHETRRGGSFAVHTDFTCHACTGLRNEMVFITYLNKNWKPSWSGALELWDSGSIHCVEKVEPEFGRSVLLLHGPVNHHGHPTTLDTPPDYARRSIASYYYTNPLAKEMREQRLTSQFLTKKHRIPVPPIYQIKKFVKMLVPPIAWSAVKKITKH